MAFNDYTVRLPMTEASGTRTDTVHSLAFADDNGNVTRVTGPVGTSAVFNGNASLSNGNATLCSSTTSGITVAAFVKFDDIPSTDESRFIVSRWRGSSNREYVLVLERFSGGSQTLMRFIVSDGSSFNGAEFNYVGSMTAGVWYMVAGWWDGVETPGYNNQGVFVKEVAGNQTEYTGTSAYNLTGYREDATVNTVVGAGHGNVAYFKGDIGPVYFWRRSLVDASPTIDYTDLRAFFAWAIADTGPANYATTVSSVGATQLRGVINRYSTRVGAIALVGGDVAGGGITPSTIATYRTTVGVNQSNAGSIPQLARYVNRISATSTASLVGPVRYSTIVGVRERKQITVGGRTNIINSVRYRR